MRRTALDSWICELEGVEVLTRDYLEKLQLSRLNALLRREKARNGFYSGLPEQLGSLDALAALPFTTAADLADNAAGMLLGSAAEVRRIISGATSGTTGPAKRVFFTARDLEHTAGFFAAGISELVQPGDAVLVAMPFSGPDGLGELICRAVERLGGRGIRAGVGKSLGEYSALLDAERPDAYIGMSVPLLSLLRWRAQNGLRPVIARALVSGDACPEGVCAAIEGLLGTRLFPHYGSREMCLGGAVTCPAHEGMHLRENHIIPEIIDENGCVLPEGEWGELVITTIDMQALPLIRYRTGDRTRILPACECGGVTRRIDRVHRLDGEAAEQLDSALFALPGLIDCSYELEGRLHIHAVGRVTREEIAGVLPGREFELSVEEACECHCGCYTGKRYIARRYNFLEIPS